jgi:hypothetical protein
MAHVEVTGGHGDECDALRSWHHSTMHGRAAMKTNTGNAFYGLKALAKVVRYRGEAVRRALPQTCLRCSNEFRHDSQ